MALVTVNELLEHLRIDRRGASVPALEIWNEDPAATGALVSVLSSGVRLEKRGGQLPGVDSLLFSDYPTLDELTEAIESAGSGAVTTTTEWPVLSWRGWRTRPLTHPDTPSSLLEPVTSANALGYSSRVTLSVFEQHYFEELIDRAQSLIEGYCGREFEEAAHSELYDGNGREVLTLRNYPVSSVSAVYLVCDDEESEITDYEVDEADGVLTRDEGWPQGYRNIKVEYTAGYSTVPAELKAICLEVAGMLYRQAGRDPRIRSERLGRYAATFFDSPFGAQLEARLALWRRLL